MNKIGFIGGGNMGGALASAAVKAVGKENVLVVDRDEQTTAACAERIGATVGCYECIAKECRVIFLAVKPNLVEMAAKTLVPLMEGRTDAVIVSMAAGVKLEKLNALFGEDAHVIRMMPNTPAAVGEGMIVYACSTATTDADRAAFAEAMSKAGKLDAIDEGKIDLSALYPAAQDDGRDG